MLVAAAGSFACDVGGTGALVAGGFTVTGIAAAVVLMDVLSALLVTALVAVLIIDSGAPVAVA